MDLNIAVSGFQQLPWNKLSHLMDIVSGGIDTRGLILLCFTPVLTAPESIVSAAVATGSKLDCKHNSGIMIDASKMPTTDDVMF